MNSKRMIVGRNRVSVISDNMIHVTVVGEQTAQIAQAQSRLNDELEAGMNGLVDYLVDLNQSEKNSPEARRLWKRVCEKEKTHKVAMYGMHPVAWVLAHFIIAIVKRGRIRYFKTRKEGLAWIQQ